MKKSELKSLIKEMLQEELGNVSLTEAAQAPGYAIKAWENPEMKKGTPAFDSTKKGKLYATFDEVLAALKTSELSELGAYEITWIKTGETK